MLQVEESIPTKIRYTKDEAAVLLSMNLRSLNYRLASGELTSVRDGGRVYILHETIHDYARVNHDEPIVPVTSKGVR